MFDNNDDWDLPKTSAEQNDPLANQDNGLRIFLGNLGYWLQTVIQITIYVLLMVVFTSAVIFMVSDSRYEKMVRPYIEPYLPIPWPMEEGQSPQPPQAQLPVPDRGPDPDFHPVSVKGPFVGPGLGSGFACSEQNQSESRVVFTFDDGAKVEIEVREDDFVFIFEYDPLGDLRIAWELKVRDSVTWGTTTTANCGDHLEVVPAGTTSSFEVAWATWMWADNVKVWQDDRFSPTTGEITSELGTVVTVTRHEKDTYHFSVTNSEGITFTCETQVFPDRYGDFHVTHLSNGEVLLVYLAWPGGGSYPATDMFAILQPGEDEYFYE